MIMKDFVADRKQNTTPKFKTLKAELNPIWHLLTLLGAHHILHVSRIRVNKKTLIHNF